MDAMSKLEQGIAALGLDCSDRKFSLLETYIGELELWNSRLNLVSVENTEQLIVRHILDSLSAVKLISALEGDTVADIGSGAGLPGFPLAIFLEDRHFTLIERSGKKTGFLRSTAALLGLVDRIGVMNSDVKTVKQQFDIVTLRAFREFGDFYGSLKAVTVDGGVIAAYKGRMDSIEFDLRAANIPEDKVEVARLEVPFLEEERHLLLVRPE